MRISWRQRRLTARNRERGFTLIESIVALTILAIGLLAMMGLQLQSFRQAQWGRHTSDGAVLARDQLEVFNRTPWSAAALQPTGWTTPVTVTRSVQSASGLKQEHTFNLQWRITVDATEPDLRHIDVRVSWREDDQEAAAPDRRYAVSSMRYNS